MSSRSRACWAIQFVMIMAVVIAAGCGAKDDPRSSQPADGAKTMMTKTGIEMVAVPAGEFVMGDDQGEDEEKPAHRVQVSEFYMDTCEVTQASFEALMGKNPSKFKSPDQPVERVSWLSAIQYCNMRSRKEGLKPCYNTETLACDFAADGYRLPTEAEWEYACRAGGATQWSCGEDAGKLEAHAWIKSNAAKTTHPVKQKAPNAWGLYDMHGNVAEWCHDFFAEGYASAQDAKDPLGPAEGEERVVRGGSFQNSGEGCRSAARASQTPRFADACFGFEAYGFRCVRRPGAK
jgi:formylglycine-generating enzyme required for sulfatase activity